MKLLEAGKMSEETYVQTLNAIDQAMKLLEAGQMSEDSYVHTLDSIDQAMKLLEAGKMSEETYVQTLNAIDQAMKLLEAGQMSEDSYVHTLDSIDQAMKLLEAGKMSEEAYVHTLDSIDQAMKLLEAGAISEEDFLQILDYIHQIMDLLENGKINEEEYLLQLANLLKKLEGLSVQFHTNSRNISSGLNPMEVNQTSVVGQSIIIPTSPEAISNDRFMISGFNSMNSSSPIDSEVSTSMIDKLTEKSDFDDQDSSFGNLLSSDYPIDSESENVDIEKVPPISKQSNNVNYGLLATIAGGTVAGTLVGGKLYADKHDKYLRFSSKDWENLSDEYHMIIENLMVQVGFDEFEIDTFKEADFKVLKEPFMELKKYLDTTVKNNITIKDELFQLYNFSVFENDKIIDYLLFIVMIIDGKDFMDHYNFVNLLNQYNSEISDISYDGLFFFDCLDSE